MATKAPLSLYADTPEAEKVVQEYRDQQKLLMDSLVNRKQLFDPTLLAIAQGLLSPTKTGSFGEAIANAAGQAAPVMQAEEKRAQDIAKMRFDMAQQNLQSYQATQGDKAFRELVNRARPGQPAAPGAPAAAGAPVAGAAPSGATPQANRPITSADIASLASRPGMEGKAKILSDMIKSDRDRFSISMNGIVFDKDTQQYLNLEIPGQKQEPFTTRFGRFEMTPYEYSQYKMAEAAGEGQQWVDKFRGVASSGAPAKPALRPTVAEAAAEAKGAETKATETAKDVVANTRDAINAGKDSTGRLASYSALRSIASRPDAKEIFGIFNRPDFGSALLNLIQEGVRAPGQASIQAGALEDSLRNIGLPQDQIDRYRFGLSVMANIQLQQAKLAAGQGAISNFERELFSSATLSPKDNPGTILAKLSMLEARANYDKQRAAALRKSKMDADDFMDTPEGQKMSQDYLNQITNIAANMGVRTPARPAQRPAAGNAGPAAAQLREELGLPPQRAR